MPSKVLPRTRARLVELGYPAPLAEALLGLAAALEPSGRRLRIAPPLGYTPRTRRPPRGRPRIPAPTEPST